MISKREREQREIQHLIEHFRKFSDDQLRQLINVRFPAQKENAPNKKAFKAVLKETGIL